MHTDCSSEVEYFAPIDCLETLCLHSLLVTRYRSGEEAAGSIPVSPTPGSPPRPGQERHSHCPSMRGRYGERRRGYRHDPYRSLWGRGQSRRGSLALAPTQTSTYFTYALKEVRTLASNQDEALKRAEAALKNDPNNKKLQAERDVKRAEVNESLRRAGQRERTW